MNLLAHFSYK